MPLTKLGFEIALKPHLETSEIAEDLRSVLNSELPETVKERLINARLGQGGFRAALLESWGGKCALTQLDVPEALRASHVKAWSNSDNQERLDPNNGILLSATIDALFDRHLITFDKKGRVIVASELKPLSLEKCGLKRGSNADLTVATQRYLDWHRSKFETLRGAGTQF